MKILWISNSPWSPSGYGSQTRQAISRIAAAGYEVECVANDGSRGDRDWNGILVRGSGIAKYSRDSVREDVERSGADWVISLYDAWVYTDRSDAFEGMSHVIGWMPVDHYPTPLSLYPWLEKHGALAMSQFGQWALGQTAEGFSKAPDGTAFPVMYAPHAIETVYQPSDQRFREIIDVPKSAYLVGIVAANFGTKLNDRKGYSDMFHALGPFMRNHPDAYLYVHTLQNTPDGIDLALLAQFCGIDVARLRWADQYAIVKGSISDEQMSHIYSSFDVLLATSRGEGFGIPVIEAQACGTPVIVSNWTAQTELVADHHWRNDDMNYHVWPSGWTVPVDPYWDPYQASDFAKPMVGTIIRALEEAYARRDDASLGEAAIAKAAQYQADTVFDQYWRPLLAAMERDAIRPKPSPKAQEVLSRQQRRLAARKKVRA